jgi:hypothetical protein
VQTAVDLKPTRAAYGPGMRFLRRHRYLLLFLAVLVFGCVMVLNQFIANESAHLQLREDFILLQERGEGRACQQLYQSLIEALPDTSDKILLDDLQRTALLVNSKTPDLDNLVWKYHVSVKKELQRRSEQRLSRAIQRAEKPWR